MGHDQVLLSPSEAQDPRPFVAREDAFYKMHGKSMAFRLQQSWQIPLWKITQIFSFFPYLYYFTVGDYYTLQPSLFPHLFFITKQ